MSVLKETLKRIYNILDIGGRKRKAEDDLPPTTPSAKNRRLSGAFTKIFRRPHPHGNGIPFRTDTIELAPRRRSDLLAMSRNKNPNQKGSVDMLHSFPVQSTVSPEFTDDDEDEEDTIYISTNHRKPVSPNIDDNLITFANPSYGILYRQHTQKQQPTVVAATTKPATRAPPVRFSRMPDLYPIVKQKPAQNSILNGHWSVGRIDNNNAGGRNNISAMGRSNLSLKKNVVAAPQQRFNYLPSQAAMRSFDSANSIVLKQHNDNSHTEYKNLLEKVKLKDHKDAGAKLMNGCDPIVIDDDIQPPPRRPRKHRTDEEILAALRPIDDVSFVADLPPINSIKSELQLKPELKDSRIAEISGKYNVKDMNRSNEISRLIESCSQITLNKNAQEYKRRLLHDWPASVQFVIPVDEPEVEVDDFPAFTNEQKQCIDKAMRGGSKQEKIVCKFNMSITRNDLNTLDWYRQSWLNDEIINFYMNLLMERSELREGDGYPKVFATNTFFLDRLTSGGYSAVKRWTRKVDIFAKELVLVPVHVNGVHWCMAIVDMMGKTIKYYDSMGSPNDKVLAKLENYLQEEMKDKKQQVMDMAGWRSENVAGIPRQENGSDCGVFSCMFAEFRTRNRPFVFSQANMEYFRQKMVLEISTGNMLL